MRIVLARCGPADGGSRASRHTPFD